MQWFGRRLGPEGENLVREYKVEPLKIKSAIGVVFLTAPNLEQILNEHAAQGWIFDKVVQSVTAVMKAENVLIVFYRDRH